MATERAQEVIDRISWLEHALWIAMLRADDQPSVLTALAAGDPSASAARGRRSFDAAHEFALAVGDHD